MIDFIKIATRSKKRGVVEIYPKFDARKSSDLMIRGGDFYAIWVDDRGLWSKDEQDAILLIDRELDIFAEEYKKSHSSEDIVTVLHMWDVESGTLDRWHKFCKDQRRDSYHALDEKLIFQNDVTSREDYASKRLPYPIVKSETPAYDKMMSVLYSEEERHKLEWAIGAIVSGDSVKIQKFVVLYGPAGTGKSTVISIIEQLFEGYCAVFDAKALGSSNNSFALEPFRSNPLVAIQHDGDLSKIEDNTRLNSLVSHELMPVNEKFKSIYEHRFKAFLFMGTNRPVKITDAKSGLIRRLIDVSPTGNLLEKSLYDQLNAQISFELGGIAYHCLQVYRKNPKIYDNYIPKSMLGASNDCYNFVSEYYYTFKDSGGISLQKAWEEYKTFCEDSRVTPMKRILFKEELKNYFEESLDRYILDDGTRIRSYYKGLKTKLFDEETPEAKAPVDICEARTIQFEAIPSIFDEIAKDWPAQYANESGTPSRSWDDVHTTLKDLDTSKLHYVRPPLNHIVIDFDIPDENGNKSFERNLSEASKWPRTYAEVSRSGNGIHLHYIYDDDPRKLKNIYSPHVEIKVFNGKSALRRRLSLCTSDDIVNISSGLPLKEEKLPVLNVAVVTNEASIRRQIERNLRREIHKNTAPSVSMIKKILDDAYASGVPYDVSNMQNAILGFAVSSHNQSKNCLKLVSEMKFKSAVAPSVSPDDFSEELHLVIFDCEVYQNLFIICWKPFDDGKSDVNVMLNPDPIDVFNFFNNFDIIGFNNLNYDNPILYARGVDQFSLMELYKLSRSMIEDGVRGSPASKSISYTDIYDFSSKKQSLKKFEIELDLPHMEMDIPWDEPVPEDRWDDVIEYCKNDVLATEAVMKARSADFAARKTLASLTKMSVNDRTNDLSAAFVFNGEKYPQGEFIYRFMGDIPDKVYRSQADAEKGIIFTNFGDECTLFDEEGRPVFPGYKYDKAKRESTYRGEVVGEGGYVYAEPGMYTNIALLDVESMHPTSARKENIFGKRFTKRFGEIVDARLAIKHHDIEKARSLLDGALIPYLDDESTLEGLKSALKIVINSVYGLTSAKFKNPFRDERNIDNIVAKRGALFMINLKHEVQSRGFTVAHIKTDSIKIPNATPEIIKFVMDYGEQYGYTFQHEATYDRMCLVNDAVYIAKYDTAEACQERYGYIPEKNEKHPGEWTATGAQFAVPYVFKTLFSKEPVVFKDLCEVKSVTKGAIYIDANENLPEGEHDYHFVGRVGQFCPIKPGFGGGKLLRKAPDPKTGEPKYSSVTGAKDWRWLESNFVKKWGKEDDIDLAYYDKLVDAAKEVISKYGNFDDFVSENR